MADIKTLLIVEHDPEVAEAMTAHFEDLGYAVDSSRDGLEAMLKIREEAPRVVLMGLTTPRLGGVDALRMLRRWQPDMSIVLTDSDRLPCRSSEERAGLESEWQTLDKLVALAASPPFARPDAVHAPAPAIEPARSVSPEPPRVLVVDDLEDVREMLRDVLEAEGYAVEVAPDAQTATAKVAALRPQVVLLDIAMPGLSGISALQQLRARDPNLGIIMVTGNGDENIARRTLALGAFDYVTKPVDLDYLRRSIETLLLMRSLLPDAGTARASLAL
jgi:DNA-binding response OmpR family regulator